VPRTTRFEVDLRLAHAVCDAARASAEALGALVSVAVVDGGGHLVVFERMDGAEIAGPTLAVGKAFTAVAHRTATADLVTPTAPGGDLAGLPSAAGGRYVCFPGGLPLWDRSRVVGGIGVSGGTGAQDHEAALAGAAVFRRSAG
jgi:uncharacterized protein GlcG (DUF336 family)